MGPRGDAIAEADWCVGQLMAHLEQLGLLNNTLIIFSSDNGPVLDDGYQDEAVEKIGNHKPAGGLRGGKYSLFDGGTHIPFFVYWKGYIKPAISNAMICQMDLTASLGKLIGAKIPKGLDSQNHLSTLTGKSQNGRKDLVIEAQGRLAYLQHEWAMIPPYKGQKRNKTGNELGNLNDYGLFYLATDKSQNENQAIGNPKLLKKMQKRLFELIGGFYRKDVPEEPLK